MRKVTGLVALGVFALGFSGCKAPDTHDADVKAISATEAQWNKDYAAKDADKLAEHYTNEAVVMMGGSPALVGKRAVLKEMMNMIRDPAFALSFTAKTVEVAKSGDVGYTQGTYSLTMTDPVTKIETKSTGTYLTVYRKQEDGTWQAVEDSVSPDAPPPAPAAVAAPTPKGKAFHVTPFD